MASKPNTKKVSSHDHKLSDKTLAKIHSPLGPVAVSYCKEEENIRISAEQGEEKNEIKRLEAKGKEKRLVDKKIARDCLTRASKRMVVDNPGGTVTIKRPLAAIITTNTVLLENDTTQSLAGEGYYYYTYALPFTRRLVAKRRKKNSMRPLITQDKLEKLIAKFIKKMDEVVAPAIATAKPYRQRHDPGRTFSRLRQFPWTETAKGIGYNAFAKALITNINAPMSYIREIIRNDMRDAFITREDVNSNRIREYSKNKIFTIIGNAFTAVRDHNKPQYAKLVAQFLKHADTPRRSFEEMILRISKEADIAIEKIDKKILAWIAVNPNGTHKECGKRYRLKANVVRVRLERIASKPAVIDAIWDYKPLRQLILARPKTKQNSIVTISLEWDTIDDDGDEGWADTHAFAMWSSENPAGNPKPNIAEICKKDPRTPLEDDEWDRQFQASTDIAYQELRTEVMNMDGNTLRPPRRLPTREVAGSAEV